MKKLLVLLLSLVFVVIMATASFAVATTSVDGEVVVEWTNTDAFAGSVDGYISFDLAKDFGEGYKAGLKIKADPTTDGYYVVKYLAVADVTADDVLVPGGVADADGNLPYFVPTTGSVNFETAGWVEMTCEKGVFTAKTAIAGNAAKYDLGGEYDLNKAAGIQFVTTTLMEGLTGTFIVNDGSVDYNFLLKADYATDTLGLGFGYQAGPDAMYAWGSFKLMDSLTLSGEYGMRTDLSAIEAKVAYAAEPLTANVKFITTTADGYVFVDEDYENVYNAFGEDGKKGMIVVADATYKLSDALSVNGEFGYAMVEDVTWVENEKLSYKVGAEDKLSDKLTLSGSYESYAGTSTITATATYLFAEGLEGVLEVENSTDTTFTASVTATL